MAKDNWDKFIDECVEDSEIKVCKTSKEVHDIMLREFKRAYEGKVSMGRIEAFADDATESICLRLHIPQE